jgi:hypothetical protein
MSFNGMLGHLRRWARSVGLLRGQRSSHAETALVKHRNLVAHPTSYELVMPNEASQTIQDLAEFINQLWGHPTPGGRLYPGPISREVVGIAWPTDSIRPAQTEVALAEQLAAPQHQQQADTDTPTDSSEECVIVRASRNDPDLMFFQTRYEATHYPADFLWGPGTREDAAAWLQENQPHGDECEFVDRVFAVQWHDDKLYLPMRPDVAATLPAPERAGTWLVMRADNPNDAWNHARNRVTSGDCCQDPGPCSSCSVDLLTVGNYQAIEDVIETNRTDPAYTLEPYVATPFATAIARTFP